MLSATVDGWNMDVTAELTTDRYPCYKLCMSAMPIHSLYMLSATVDGWNIDVTAELATDRSLLHKTMH